MMTPKAGGIYIIDVSEKVPYRKTKHCVCVSAGAGKYLLINTRKCEKYDAIILSSSNYDFLRGEDRYLEHTMVFEFSADKLVKKVGILSKDDVDALVNEIIQSKTIAKADKSLMIGELGKSFMNRPH